MEKKPDATMQEIEDVLDGNLCRCTGYRPIFDAFKSMASDATPDLTNRIPDIEDMDKVKKCNNLDQFLIGLCELAKTKNVKFSTLNHLFSGIWRSSNLCSHLDTIGVHGKD